MGQIDSRRVSNELPAETAEVLVRSSGRDQPPTRIRVYRRLSDDLEAVGEPALPANATAAQARQAIAVAIGKALKAEIDNDPEARGYAGKTDQEIADLMNGPFLKAVGESAKTSFLTVTNIAGDVLTVVAENAAPLTLGQLDMRGAVLRFIPGAVTAALQNQSFAITAATDTTLTVPGLPAPPVAGDFGVVVAPVRRALRPATPRALRRIPHAPNIVTAADIAAAKV